MLLQLQALLRCELQAYLEECRTSLLSFHTLVKTKRCGVVAPVANIAELVSRIEHVFAGTS